MARSEITSKTSKPTEHRATQSIYPSKGYESYIMRAALPQGGSTCFCATRQREVHMYDVFTLLLTALIVAFGFAIIVGGPAGALWLYQKLGDFGYYLLKEAVLGARDIIGSLFVWFGNWLKPKSTKKKKKKP